MTTKSPWSKRFFVDCEFTDFDHRELVSLAIVSEEGDEFYVELKDFNAQQCSSFVSTTVLPQLGQYPQRVMTRPEAARALLSWFAGFALKPRPLLCFDYVGDLELMQGLVGSFPPGWKVQFLGLKLDMARLEAWFAEHGGRHHALMDARAKAVAFI
jgi:hypothetical protein